MFQHPTLLNLAQLVIKHKDRYEAHTKAKTIISNLCQDRDFLHETLKGRLRDPGVLHNATELAIPLLYSGDIIISLNIFSPLKGTTENITHDNIHHHGWRLLTTGVVSGNGYETINFVRGSHRDRTGVRVNLEVEEIYRHVQGDVRFIDSFQPHVVFHNTSTCSTLALWSADRFILTQRIKRRLENFPNFRRVAVNTIHKLGLGSALNLNQVNGTYFRPSNGKIVETQNYHKSFDGYRREILRCWFIFFQQIKFNDPEYWMDVKNIAPPEAIPMIDQLLANEPIRDIGILGHPRRRFSKAEILEAIDYPAAQI